ncbi:MAG: alkaline phosphatase, partial [Armatimonadetes bacterium]|nr:alkaline phosphatase [Candidatus Hippobium faecium]
MKKIMLTLIVIIMAVSVFAANNYRGPQKIERSEINWGSPESLSASETFRGGFRGGKKNVILMIGDGMGINSVNQAEFYMGKDFPFTNWETSLFATTYSQNCPDGYDPAKAWTDPEKAIPNLRWLAHCTDSAAAATALHSGLKTNGGIVNESADGRYMYIPIGQYMKSLGYAVGSISTVTWYDATPSGPHGHSYHRGDITVASDMINHPIDVLGGSGNPYYNGNGIKRPNEPSYSNFISKDLWDIVEGGKYGYKLLADSESIKALAKEKHPKGPYFLSLPNTGDLPYMKLGELSKHQYKDCPEDIITLREMAESALNVLKENEKGFYLMVEGGAIDHGNHNNNWEHSVCQMASFADAVEGVCKWVEENSNWDETLLVVTADHQTGGIINEDGTYWVTDNGKGNRPNQKYTSGGHTNLPVPVFVKGSYANNIFKRVKGTDPVLGKYIDNTDIPQFFGEFVGFEFPLKPTRVPF